MEDLVELRRPSEPAFGQAVNPHRTRVAARIEQGGEGILDSCVDVGGHDRHAQDSVVRRPQPRCLDVDDGIPAHSVPRIPPVHGIAQCCADGRFLSHREEPEPDRDRLSARPGAQNAAVREDTPEWYGVARRTAASCAGEAGQARIMVRPANSPRSTTLTAAIPGTCQVARLGFGAKIRIAPTSSPVTRPPRWPCQEMNPRPTTVITALMPIHIKMPWTLPRTLMATISSAPISPNSAPEAPTVCRCWSASQ